VHFLVILGPVLLGLIGFAVDLGMLYSAKGELKTGASAMALAAAQQLIGTDAAATAAGTAAQITSNNYYFNGFPIGQTTGNLNSTVSDPEYSASLADALGGGGGGASSASSRYARVTVTGQVQLLFWSLIPIVSDRRVTVQTTALAGISAPLCQACSIEPFAVTPLDANDMTDFGFTRGTKYSFAYSCSGTPAPPLLSPGTQTVSYLLLNRWDQMSSFDESSQAFQDGAGGVPGSTNSAQACFRINTSETIWVSATVNACTATAVAATVADSMCGMETRFETPTAAVCSTISNIDTLTSIYPADTDIMDHDVYSDYTGAGRRVITIPVVDQLSASDSMMVLGFRQFLVIPSQATQSSVDPTDRYGRFVAMYIGSVVPVKQGRLDGCQQPPAGPGKVVLHL